MERGRSAVSSTDGIQREPHPVVGEAACRCIPLVALCPVPQSEKHSQPSPWVNLSLWPSGGHFPFFAPTGRNVPARGRVKRVYPRTSPRVRRTRNMPALKGRNNTRWAFVPPFQGFAYCGFTTRGVVRGSCRVAMPQADLFRPFGAMPESSRQSKASSQNPAPHASAG